MTTKRIVPAIALFLLVLGLAACNEPAKPQVAIVDPGQVFQTSQAGQKAQQVLQGINEEFRTKLQEITDKTKDNSTTMEDAEQAMAQLRNTMVARQQSIVKSLENGLQKAMEAYRLRTGVTVILPAEQVMSFDPSLDATKEIIADLDKLDLGLDKPAQ